jgi:Flp pilus assembly protein TadD
MRRVAALLALGTLIGLAAAAATFAQYQSRDRQYRNLLASGEQALAAGNGHAAIEAFSGALALRPDAMVAYYRRGEAYRTVRRDAEAIRDLREAIRLAPDAPQPMVALARLYDDHGDPAQAAKWYEQAMSRLQGVSGEDPTLLYALALAHYRAGSPEAAKPPLLRILARDDAIGEAQYLLGLAYRDTGTLDRAVAALEQAIRVAPSLSAAREELADIYRVQGRTDDEMAQLQALAALDAQADRRVAIALAQARRGQFDAALSTLAAADAPTDSRLQLAYGRVALARAERTLDRAWAGRALGALEKALGGTARRSEGLALYGRALYLSGDPAAAERILREAIATSPVDAQAFAYLADAADRLGHLADARDALVDLDTLEGDTASPDARAARARRIGAIALRAGDPSTAAAFLNQAVEGGYVDAATLGMLAQARWQAGDADEARSALARALALAPGNAELQRLSRTIR